MPADRTCVSEVYTALGVCCDIDTPELCASLPSMLRNVDAATWNRIKFASLGDDLKKLALLAWSNGRAFLASRDGLRAGVPFLVEWKGNHKPPAYEYLPADIRVNHVYLLSCKYGSDVLLNSSPGNLFERTLSRRRGSVSIDWFFHTVPELYQALYERAKAESGLVTLPDNVMLLRGADRDQLQARLRVSWSERLDEEYRRFSSSVAEATSGIWKSQMAGRVAKEEMLWRLLRLADAPYFVLGADKRGAPIRVRIATPWDWRQHFALKSLEFHPRAAGQPEVGWRAVAEDRSSGRAWGVEGHVEVRWSHGKFCGAPEAKVYLDTAYSQVPGYFPLDPL